MGTFLSGDVYQKADFDATIDLNGIIIELGSAKKKIDFDNDQSSNNSNSKSSHAEKYNNSADKKNNSRGSRGDAGTKSTSFVTMMCDNDNGNSNGNGNGNGNESVGKRSPASPSHSYTFAEYTEGKSKTLDIGDGFSKSKSGVLREKGTRRTRVSQCKNLRGFILGFENSWLLKHGVAAKVFISLYIFLKLSYFCCLSST